MADISFATPLEIRASRIISMLVSKTGRLNNKSHRLRLLQNDVSAEKALRAL